MYLLLVSPFWSVISPVAPGRIAKTGLLGSTRNPELTNSSPCAEKEVGMWRLDKPDISQSSLPSRSYERSLREPLVTISVRTPFSHTNGVDQLLPSSRSTRQSSRPVLAS